MDVLKINDKGEIEILPYLLKIKEFNAIYTYDTTKSKSRYVTQLTFVWLFADFSSPYVKDGLDDDDKWSIIKADIGWEEPMRNKKMINAAIKKYRELNSTETMRLLEAAQSAINSIIKYFNDLDMSEKNEKGVLVNNISQVMTSLKGIGAVNKDLKKLKTDVMAELNDTGNIKGGESLAMFEDPE